MTVDQETSLFNMGFEIWEGISVGWWVGWGASGRGGIWWSLVVLFAGGQSV